MPVDLTTTASVPADTDVIVTIHEDTDDDGVAENSESQVIDDGTNTYRLDSIGSSRSSIRTSVRREAGGTTSAYSIESISVTRIPPKPDITSIDAVPGGFNITWEKKDGTSSGGWDVFRSTASGTLGTKIVDDLDVGARSYEDTSITAETVYYYTVRRVIP